MKGYKTDWEEMAKRLTERFAENIPELRRAPNAGLLKFNYAILLKQNEYRRNILNLDVKAAPIPIRYLREGDKFIMFPISANNLKYNQIYIAKNTPREDPENLNHIREKDMNFEVQCEKIPYELLIPDEYKNYITIIKEKD